MDDIELMRIDENEKLNKAFYTSFRQRHKTNKSNYSEDDNVDEKLNNDMNAAEEIKKILESDGQNNNSNMFPFLALFFLLLKGNDSGADYWRGKYDAFREMFKDCNLKNNGGDQDGRT